MIFFSLKEGDTTYASMASLMSIPSKLLEWIIKKMFSEPLERDLLITRNQHGFIKSKSCQFSPHFLLDGLTKREATKIIYLGFGKDLKPNTSCDVLSGR